MARSLPVLPQQHLLEQTQQIMWLAKAYQSVCRTLASYRNTSKIFVLCSALDFPTMP